MFSSFICTIFVNNPNPMQYFQSSTIFIFFYFSHPLMFAWARTNYFFEPPLTEIFDAYFLYWAKGAVKENLFNNRELP